MIIVNTLLIQCISSKYKFEKEGEKKKKEKKQTEQTSRPSF